VKGRQHPTLKKLREVAVIGEMPKLRCHASATCDRLAVLFRTYFNFSDVSQETRILISYYTDVALHLLQKH